MVPQFPNHLQFENVQYENNRMNMPVRMITFTVDGYPFSLKIKGNYPASITHDAFTLIQKMGKRVSEVNKIKCPLCDERFSGEKRVFDNTSICTLLDGCIDEIYEQLKKHPNVRVRLLFK